MRKRSFLLWVLITGPVLGQTYSPEHFGYRHLSIPYQRDTVHVLVLSKRGAELQRKPLFLFDQGSLPKPLIITDDQGAFPVFPFRTDSLLEEYHLAIIGKPAVPVVAPAASLKPGYLYADPATGRAPEHYLSRDNPGYYVSRNRAVLRFLRKQPWFDGRRLVLAGHSAGTTVMTRLAARSKRVTHLILSNGNPVGRIVTMLGPPRAADTTGAAAEEIFRYWEAVVARPDDKSDPGGGDTNYTMYQFSLPIVAHLKKLRIPVLVTYGTRDYSAPFNDYLRVELIRERKKNVHFKAYPGLEHNYFGLKPDGSLDYDNFNWDRAAADWQAWLRKQ